VLHSKLPEWSCKEAGAPQSIRTVIRSPADDPSLYLDISLILKTATRLPEVNCRTCLCRAFLQPQKLQNLTTRMKRCKGIVWNRHPAPT
jgi:hypothetical protein